MPDSYFRRERLSVDEIADTWLPMIDCIHRQQPTLKWIFTVSPVRHLRDGAHENNLSKSVLHLLIEKLISLYPTIANYFPAYELMMDELRDYRFYAEDMCHPSPVAIHYISDRFESTYMDAKTIAWLRRAEALHRDLQHRPIHPDSEAYRRFVVKTKLKQDQLRAELPTPPTFAR